MFLLLPLESGSPIRADSRDKDTYNIAIAFPGSYGENPVFLTGKTLDFLGGNPSRAFGRNSGRAQADRSVVSGSSCLTG